MLRLHDSLISGNGYKVRLLMAQLGLAYERVEYDLAAGETRTPGFLALNPNGRIPVLELEEGSALAESNAIQWYLAEGTRFLPEAPLERARVLQWMFFEQYSHEPYIAVLRYWSHTHQLDSRADRLPEMRERGHQAPAVMERHLGDRPFLVADLYTIADIALYAYTHVADEAGFQLGAYPAVTAWLARVASQERHVPITGA